MDPFEMWECLAMHAREPIQELPPVPYLPPLHLVQAHGLDVAVLLEKLQAPASHEEAMNLKYNPAIFPEVKKEVPAANVAGPSQPGRFAFSGVDASTPPTLANPPTASTPGLMSREGSADADIRRANMALNSKMRTLTGIVEQLRSRVDGQASDISVIQTDMSSMKQEAQAHREKVDQDMEGLRKAFSDAQLGINGMNDTHRKIDDWVSESRSKTQALEETLARLVAKQPAFQPPPSSS
ncbi:hypothetical protein DENSPDRAFT_884654 [Dentipellis sp. KUC8613]|nr:hypothetical protein DENSPDRAFT_884654 [Dentipellis sp. KUC8613]